jgi:uncharacterized OB-fold protein
MQIINKMVQCSECGCIAFPDAIYCPKCGMSYREGKAKKEKGEVFEKFSSFAVGAPTDAEQFLKETRYQISCSHRGQVIDIKTVVILPDTKCPLC